MFIITGIIISLSVLLFNFHWLLQSYFGQLPLQDAPVQPHVREALARPRLAHHALRPSQGSSQRIIGDLRSVKWSTRREERYRILSSHRAGLPTEPAPAGGGGEENHDSHTESRDGLPLGEVQVFDILHEEEDVKVPGKVKQEHFIGFCQQKIWGLIHKIMKIVKGLVHHKIKNLLLLALMSFQTSETFILLQNTN